ncbi:MAG TPA: proline dehydrogenase family protein [Bryobacteraceae bacterium]|nr:proline dehydrogenase family protein [Bryobacteraceae bacterium]
MSAFIPMLRGSFLYLSKQPTLRRWMETSRSANRLTSRFIAGLTLDDAIRVAASLRDQNTLATLDHLGENVTTLAEASGAREAYLRALDRIAHLRLGATISVKVTALGLDISEQACFDNLAVLVDRAHAIGTSVEMDMESSQYTERTLRLVHAMQARHPGGVRAVVQAYLYRTAADVEALCREHIPVRLCKGAYQEPPEVAWQLKTEVDASFLRLMERLFDRGTCPAVATHDAQILDHADVYIRRRGINAGQFEFQMLYGVRRDLQRALLKLGYSVRLYVPYGTAWYPYFMRRLAERPANVGFILRNMMRD